MPKGPKASSWFEKLTAQQCSTLLKAVGAPSSASTKGELVARLLQHPVAGQYGHEGREPIISMKTCEFVGGRDGLTVSDIKEECRKKGLKVTGTRFDLVLSLLQLAGGKEDVPKGRGPRAPSTKPEDPDRIYDRLVNKCFQGGDRMSWSNQRYKDHAGDVMRMAAKITRTETQEKGLLANRDPAALRAVSAVLRAIRDGWGGLPSPSYGDACYELGCVADDVRAVAEAFRDSLSAAEREQMVKLCEEVEALGRRSSNEGFSGVALAFCAGGGEAAEGAAEAAEAAERPQQPSPAAQPVTPGTTAGDIASGAPGAAAAAPAAQLVAA